jgi:deoxyribodipyrimidine photo-lyase
MYKKAIMWMRRDLRLHDNTALHYALKESESVIPLFIFDRHILDKLEDRDDARVTFIHDTLNGLREELQGLGSDIEVHFGYPEEIWREVLERHQPEALFLNRDYETYAKERDKKIKALAEDRGLTWHDYKDHVIFDGQEVVKDDGEPYTVFTPYKRKWLAALEVKEGQWSASRHFQPFDCQDNKGNFLKFEADGIPSLEDMGFSRSKVDIPDRTVSQGLIRNYDKTRNFPAIEGTSRLGIHFRFGTISIREKARKAAGLNETFLSELIWRDFYSNILNHFPHVEVNAFRAKYDQVEWRNDEGDFDKWREGKTGYPIVDAGMRELAATGYMHNRVRMITASFLTKHLLIDWRWGEAWFARKLLDFDLASNNGGWQWAAGSGTDAAPYFRIFNPTSQLQKFDKELKYVKRWVPEYGTDKYPEPMVDHKMARERCLETYKAALG